MTVRAKVKSLYTAMLHDGAYEWTIPELEAPAIVVAPHQDDETLGCGGTIYKKRQAGAPVTLVFLTDGCQSHSHSMSEDELRSVRRQEGFDAAKILGIEPGDVVSFNYRDRELGRDLTAATTRLREMLVQRPATQVFVPFIHDVSADHLIANQVVRAAAASCGRPIDMFEYPVWFWRRWPWTSTNGTPAPLWRQHAKDSLLWSWAVATRFRTGSLVGDVLDIKRQALEAHRSQMTRFRDVPNWPILADVEGGDWLSCFFADFEPFYRHRA